MTCGGTGGMNKNNCLYKEDGQDGHEGRGRGGGNSALRGGSSGRGKRTAR